MKCHQCTELLDEYVLAIYDSSAQDSGAQPIDEIEAHLAECADCTNRFSELAEAWPLMADSAPTMALPERLEARVMARLDAESVTPNLESAHESQGWLPYLVAAAALLLATTGIYMVRYRPNLAATQKARDIQNQIVLLEKLNEQFGQPELVYVALRDNDKPSTNAWIVFDADAMEVHFYAKGLSPLPAGKHNRLWLMYGDEVIGTSQVNSHEGNMGSTVIRLAEFKATLDARVTVESADPSSLPPDQPSGDVRFETRIHLPARP